jgi:tRNA modification GTPase
MPFPLTTIVAPLTPVQLSAVITLRVSGSAALSVLHFLSIDTCTPRLATRATYRSELNPQVTDDILVTYFKSPASYTGEDVLELSFHGNPLIVNQALTDFRSIGIRMAEPGEFTRRALAHGKLSLSQAEAVGALIHAPTAAGVASAGSVLQGGLDSIFYDIRKSLVAVLAQVESSIDFAEQVEADDGDTLPINAMLTEPRRALAQLLDSYRDAQRAIHGVQVLIVGAPNAGKSTLFNLLVGSERAIVTSEAGTTRDLITEQLHIGSAHSALSDTAGIRETDSMAEAEGVRRAYGAISKADIILILLDLSVTIPAEIAELIDQYKEQALVIGTKADLVADDTFDKVDMTISSKDGESIQRLKKVLAERIASLIPQGDVGAVLLAETQRLDCADCLAELGEMDENQPVEILAYHMRRAIAALDRTEGRNVSEQTLDALFSSFCIGK